MLAGHCRTAMPSGLVGQTPGSHVVGAKVAAAVVEVMQEATAATVAAMVVPGEEAVTLHTNTTRTSSYRSRRRR